MGIYKRVVVGLMSVAMLPLQLALGAVGTVALALTLQFNLSAFKYAEEQVGAIKGIKETFKGE